MPYNHIQPTFAGGEISPSLHSRVDLARYATALKKARNCIIHPQGGCSNRPGSKFIQETKDSSKRSRLIPFEFSSEQAYAIEFGDGYCRFYKDKAIILKSSPDAWVTATDYVIGDFVTESATSYYCIVAHTAGTFATDLAAGKWLAQTIYEIPTDYTEADVAGLSIKVSQSADVLYIAHPDHLPKELTRIDHDSWTFSAFDNKHGPFMLANIDVDKTIYVVPEGESPPSDIFDDDFEDGTLNKWTVTGGLAVQTYAGSQRMTNTDLSGPGFSANGYAPSNIAYGVWQFDVLQRGGITDIFDIRFIENAADYYSVKITGLGMTTLTLTKNGVTLASVGIAGGSEVVRTIRIERDADGTFRIYEDSTLKLTYVDTSITTSLRFRAYLSRAFVFPLAYLDNVFIATGTITGGIISPDASVDIVSSNDLFDVGHVGALFQINQRIEGQNVSSSLTAAGQTTDEILSGPIWRLLTRGTWTGKIIVEKSIDGGNTYIALRTFTSVNDNNVDTFGNTGETSSLLRLRTTGNTGWSGTANVALSTDEFIQFGIVKIDTITDGQNAVGTVKTSIGRSGIATSDWAEGSWSDYRGYPETVTFYQDRLWWGATRKEPNTSWSSEPGNYTSFIRHSPLLDSDGISVRLPSQKVNTIRNLVPLGDILALTSADDWTITSASGVMTPTTVNQRPQGFRGSAIITPIIIGNRVIIVMPKNQVIRDLGFDEFDATAYTGSPISIMSEHLFSGYSVAGMAYAQEPDSLVWFVRSDGALISLTYLPEHEVLAWTHHDTDGKVESICSIPGDDYDEIWLIVKRTIGGVTKRYVEVFEQRMASTDPADQFFVDCGLSLDNPITISGITSADPVVVTANDHGLSNGDLVDLKNIVWKKDSEDVRPDYLNGKRFKVANKTTHTFELQTIAGVDVDGSGFTDYESDGKARLVVTSVSGLGHLEGKTVAALANGMVQKPQVVTSGEIPLDSGASQIHVGLPYRMEMGTLPLEIPQRNGTMQGRKVKISEVRVQLLNSLGGKIGPSDEFEMDLLIKRDTVGSFDTPIPLFTGGIPAAFQGGWEDSGEILIQQSDPLPLTVLAVIPKLQVGG